MNTNLLRPSLLIVAALLTAAGCASPDRQRAETMEFAVRHQFVLEVPGGAGEVRAWFALPDDREDLQTIRDLRIDVEGAGDADVRTRQVRDRDGNRFLHLAARGAGGRTLTVTTRFDLEREEAVVSVDPLRTRPLTDRERERLAPYLQPQTHVVTTPEIRSAATAAVGDERNPMRQARLLYDWILDHMQYWVKDPGSLKASPVGSSVHAFEQCTGNCTDFHSLYAALCHSIGLPVRMVYGSFLKGPLDGQDKDQSYHCWIEFWAPEIGWVPLDVAVADVFVDDFALGEANRTLVDLTVAAGYHGPDPRMVDYYFGNLDARRVTWHRGRDLVLDPAPAAGPLNMLPKAHVEVDGKTLAEKAGWTRMLTFRQVR